MILPCESYLILLDHDGGKMFWTKWYYEDLSQVSALVTFISCPLYDAINRKAEPEPTGRPSYGLFAIAIGH